MNEGSVCRLFVVWNRSLACAGFPSAAIVSVGKLVTSAFGVPEGRWPGVPGSPCNPRSPCGPGSPLGSSPGLKSSASNEWNFTFGEVTAFRLIFGPVTACRLSCFAPTLSFGSVSA